MCVAPPAPSCNESLACEDGYVIVLVTVSLNGQNYASYKSQLIYDTSVLSATETVPVLQLVKAYDYYQLDPKYCFRAAASTDLTLSTLAVFADGFEIKLTPEFQSHILQYSCVVSTANYQADILLAAQSTSSAAIISIQGEPLEHGEHEMMVSGVRGDILEVRVASPAGVERYTIDVQIVQRGTSLDAK